MFLFPSNGRVREGHEICIRPTQLPVIKLNVSFFSTLINQNHCIKLCVRPRAGSYKSFDQLKTQKQIHENRE